MCWAGSVIVQELCESRGGRPGLSVLTSLLVSVDVKIYCTVLRHWLQLVPNMPMTSEDIKHQLIIIGSVPFPPVSLQRLVVCLLLRPMFMCSFSGEPTLHRGDCINCETCCFCFDPVFVWPGLGRADFHPA